MMDDNDYTQLSVLIVDDDEFMLDLVDATLRGMDIKNVICAKGGEEALMRIDDPAIHIDVMLCDLQMPEMDGVEVLRNMASRQFPGGIVLFSGEDIRILKTAESLASAHELNILGAISKPITPAAIREALSRYRSPKNPDGTQQVDIVKEEMLREGMECDQFVTYFQPKVSIATNKVEAVESLVRWNHPLRGVVAPIAFISLAEEYGLIDALTERIFDKAMKQGGEWQKAGHNIKVAVNLSVDNLNRVDLPDFLEDQAETNGMKPSDVMLELTESRLIQNLALTLDILTRLRLKGFGLSIDDFGTGYSSMEQLMNIPFTELKIDRAFVHGAAQDSAARAILESSIDLAKKLDLSIVAEGAENQEDWNLVAKLGCDMVQGYFVARPMPAGEFNQWLKNREH